jgi:hypothetical protein
MQQSDAPGHPSHDEATRTDDRPTVVPGLEARLRQVEESPVESRADSFAALHDALRDVLEGTTGVDAAGAR